MTTATIVQYTNAVAFQHSLSATFPSAPTEGNLLVAIVHINSSGDNLTGDGWTIDHPFTGVGADYTTLWSSGPFGGCWLLWKIAGSSESQTQTPFVAAMGSSSYGMTIWEITNIGAWETVRQKVNTFVPCTWISGAQKIINVSGGDAGIRSVKNTSTNTTALFLASYVMYAGPLLTFSGVDPVGAETGVLETIGTVWRQGSGSNIGTANSFWALVTPGQTLTATPTNLPMNNGSGGCITLDATFVDGGGGGDDEVLITTTVVTPSVSLATFKYTTILV